MKYRLINEDIKEKDLLDIIYENRGITREQVDELLNANDEYNNPFEIFNMDKAIEQFKQEINKESMIYILCDSDNDGYCSATIMYKFLIEDVCYNKNKVNFFMHSGKQHGLNAPVFKEIMNSNVEYLIVPDAGTNDLKQMKKLNELGIKILSLDHHQLEIDLNDIPDNTVVVNNQIGKCESKYGSGALVVSKFIEAMGYNTDKYKDLVATSLISDSMNLLSLENRTYINYGLNNIQNPLIKAYFCKNKILNPVINDVSYNFANFINATVRVGTQEEKELMLKAFIGEEGIYDYTKRNGQTIKETLQERVVRLSSNCKSRQNNTTKKTVEQCNAYITKNHLENNKVIIIKNDDKIVQSSQSGLVAMKIADNWGRPCIILNKMKDGFYSGSARAIGEIKNLKDLLDETGLCEWNKGHLGAFGTMIKEENIEKLSNVLNEKLKDFQFYDGRIYDVDKIINIEELNKNDIKTIAKLKNLWCADCRKPRFAIRGIKIDSVKIKMTGKLKCEFETNGIKCVKNWCSKQFFEDLTLANAKHFGKSMPLNITLVCEFNLDYKGNPVLEIVDANVVKDTRVIF